ncbi:MAG: LptF/LptG family permease, partial [Bacteroidota bacterium]
KLGNHVATKGEKLLCSAIGMVFIFFDKIFGTMAEQSSFSPFVATWFPNFVFGILAVYLLKNAKR